ncbi:sigma-54 dependent transcriptional regulator [uncultured Bilophila sp.]|uniref:sigma-54 interaction domain-containing protein n=1 Tax=uncultured Bilophila sp. TaxID=529385 RepID=UPI00280BA783|nr:sigma-54 dependent transcriptional regulator [uncultured Bilophila sp.]
MTNAQETNVKQEPLSEQAFLDTLINLCDDLAWGRPASEDRLFALTKEGAGPKNYVRLAEAFGMMLVKVEGREYHRSQLIADLKTRNAELEEAHRLLAERNTHLMRTIQENYQTKKIVGQCEAMRKVIQLALTIARRPINTLILGPTGAGKEVIAKAIHFNSPRREGPFVAVNCTAIPDSLFESEMFGIEKGIATGVNARKGLIEEASGGTLFLDELADMTLPNQAKLLRVLEEREVLRVGSSKPVSVDIKLIAATNANLEEAVRKGNFREDLYYRINVAEIKVPPLRERGDDILLLAQLFLERHCAYMGRPRLSLSSAVCRQLLQYGWPGNVRELNNEMERAASLTLGNRVELSDLSTRIVPDEVRCHLLGAEPLVNRDETDASQTETTAPRGYNLQDMERKLILDVLNKTGGNKSKAAELLGITREGLRKKLLRMDISDKELPHDDGRA